MAHKLGYNSTVVILKTKLSNGPIRSTMQLRDIIYSSATNMFSSIHKKALALTSYSVVAKLRAVTFIKPVSDWTNSICRNSFSIIVLYFPFVMIDLFSKRHLFIISSSIPLLCLAYF